MKLKWICRRGQEEEKAQTLTTMERLKREEAVQNNEKTARRSKPRGSCRY